MTAAPATAPTAIPAIAPFDNAFPVPSGVSVADGVVEGPVLDAVFDGVDDDVDVWDDNSALDVAVWHTCLASNIYMGPIKKLTVEVTIMMCR